MVDMVRLDLVGIGGQLYDGDRVEIK